MIKLNRTVQIILPQEDNNGKPFEDFQLTPIEEEIERITKRIGGNTITESKGQWFSEEENRLMTDNNRMIEWSFSDDLSGLDRLNFRLDLLGLIRYGLEILEQEAISLKVDNILYIIEDSDSKEAIKEHLEAVI